MVLLTRVMFAPGAFTKNMEVGYQLRFLGCTAVLRSSRLSDGLDRPLPHSLDFFSHAQCLGEVGKGQKELCLARGKDLYGG